MRKKKAEVSLRHNLERGPGKAGMNHHWVVFKSFHGISREGSQATYLRLKQKIWGEKKKEKQCKRSRVIELTCTGSRDLISGQKSITQAARTWKWCGELWHWDKK